MNEDPRLFRKIQRRDERQRANRTMVPPSLSLVTYGTALPNKLRIFIIMASFASVMDMSNSNRGVAPPPRTNPEHLWLLRLARQSVATATRERWMRRLPKEHNNQQAVKRTEHNNNPDSNSSDLLVNDIFPTVALLGRIVSCLDPHEVPMLVQTCRAAARPFGYCLQQDQPQDEKEANLLLWNARWQGIVRYFGIPQHLVHQLQATLQYPVRDLVRYLTHIAATLQAIYGPTFVVHPLHRSLVVHERILRYLTGMVYVPLDDDDEEEGNEDDDEEELEYPPLFHPRARKLPLRTNYLYTQFARFCWSTTAGDHHYSFAKAECDECGHGEDLIQDNLRTNLLDDHGYVFLYLYQDEDNFKVVRMYRQLGNHDDDDDDDDDGDNDDTLWMADDGNGEQHTACEQCASVLQYFVLGNRRPGYDEAFEYHENNDSDDGDSNDADEKQFTCIVPPDELLRRLHWLRQRDFVTISDADWQRACRAAKVPVERYPNDCIAIIE